MQAETTAYLKEFIAMKRKYRSTMRTPVAAVIAVIGLMTAACGSSSGSSGSTNSGAGSINGQGKPFVMWTEGGSNDFQQALQGSFLGTFAKKYGFKTATDPFCCGISNLQQQDAANHVKWSVLQLASVDELQQAESKGLLAKLDPKVVPFNLLSPGSHDDYGVFGFLNAFVLGYLPASYPDASTAPTSFADLFDTQKYPGKRCLYKYPEYAGVMEGALESSGVPTSQLYPLDVSRAFTKLASIKSDIVWYTSGSQATQLLANGTCKMAAILNGVAQSASRQGTQISIHWKGSVIVPVGLAIPKKGPNNAAAQQFIAQLLTDHADQVKFYNSVAYPIPLKNPNLPASIAKWAPVGNNLDGTVTEDSNWYIKNIATLTKQFNNFLVTGKP
jgi:putative spermidine/putrescine transport system substrate-binding protein